LKDSYCTIEKLSPEKELTVKNSLALIVSGELEAYKNEGGKRIYLKRISEGEIAGIATLFDKNGQYISTLVAKKASEAVLLSEDFILSLLRASPDFSERFFY
jgi:CRP-like cAMP-binding protein